MPNWADGAEMHTLFIGIAAALCAGAGAASIVRRSLPTTRQTTVPEAARAGLAADSRAVPMWVSRLAGLRWGTRSVPVHAASVAAWCDSLSRRLRAGDTLRAALQDSVPGDSRLRTRTDPLRRSLSHGSPVGAAVEAAPMHARDPHLQLLCSVIAATAEFGGSAAAPIDRVGATLRLRSADGQERDAQSAQARLSAHVLTVVPLGVLALLVGTDADVRHFISGGLGFAVVIFGLALNLSGWRWMHRVVEGGAS